MTFLNEKVTRNGQVLTQRVWSLLAAVEKECGVTLRVVQGGFKGSGGASASAGTHDRGDVLDISLYGIPESKWEAVVVALRKRNVCAWVRAPKYGWTSTGPHIHGVVRDSYWGLSAGAANQVSAYDKGLDGLNSATAASRPYKGRDYHPRPTQWRFPTPTVQWSNCGMGKKNSDVLLVQKALARYVGLDYSSAPGTWGPRTSAAWTKAVIKSGGKKGLDLLKFLGAQNKTFKAAP